MTWAGGGRSRGCAVPESSCLIDKLGAQCPCYRRHMLKVLMICYCRILTLVLALAGDLTAQSRLDGDWLVTVQALDVVDYQRWTLRTAANGQLDGSLTGILGPARIRGELETLHVGWVTNTA